MKITEKQLLNLEEQFVTWQHERLANNRGRGNIEKRRKTTTTCINSICIELGIGQEDLYTASVNRMEQWYLKFERKASEESFNLHSARYIFRLMLEMKGSSINPIRKSGWNRKPLLRSMADVSSRKDKDNKASKKLSIVLDGEGRVEVTMSKTDTGLLQYRITQLEY